MKYLLITFLLLSCVFIDENDNKETQIPEGAFPIVYKSHLYIKGMTDSIKGNYVFDTGASNLYIDSTHYADKGFVHENTFNAMLPGAGKTPQRVIVVADSVQFLFGENTYTTTIVPILRLKPILGDIADGILGMEYFYNSILEINYEQEYMKIYKEIDSIDLQGFSKIKLNKKDNRLFIPLEVTINDSINIIGEYQVDFGSGGSVSFVSSVTNTYKLKQNINNKVPYFTKYGGVGGESSSYHFISNSMKIGDFEFNNITMDFSVDRSGAMASNKHLGLLGNDIFERFNVYIDFINNNLYLKPNNQFNKAFKASKLGFSFIDRGQTLKSWIVTGLYKSSNAENAGLKIDDKIIMVNGINVSEINYKRQKTFFNNLNTVDLKINRNGENLDIHFDLAYVL